MSPPPTVSRDGKAGERGGVGAARTAVPHVDVSLTVGVAEGCRGGTPGCPMPRGRPPRRLARRPAGATLAAYRGELLEPRRAPRRRWPRRAPAAGGRRVVPQVAISRPVRASAYPGSPKSPREFFGRSAPADAPRACWLGGRRGPPTPGPSLCPPRHGPMPSTPSQEPLQLSESLADSRTAELLDEACTLDIDALDSRALPRGFRSGLDGAVSPVQAAAPASRDETQSRAQKSRSSYFFRLELLTS